MLLEAICNRVALRELKKSGTLVECMRDDWGINKGEVYRVVGGIAGFCLRLEKGGYSHTATHFRKAE